MAFDQKTLDKAQKFTDLLAERLPKKPLKDQWGYVYVNNHTVYQKTIRSVAKSLRLKGTISAGSYRMVLVCESFVLKTRYYDQKDDSVKKETAYFQRMRKTKWRNHFPESVLFRSKKVEVVLQERCSPSTPRYNKVCNDIYDLARFFKLDQDVHEYNIGWRKENGVLFPVFIDPHFHYQKAPKAPQGLPQESVMATWIRAAEESR